MTAEKDDINIRTLPALARALAQCRRCALYKNATQVVPGEGTESARVMIVGEQPGNDEDLAGHPFVGPAGKVLDRALADAGIDRRTVFITNAVKHFKFVRRGKRRLHQRPNGEEIDICRKWNEIERRILAPDIVVALGATAARSLLDRTVTIASSRGRILDSPSGKLLVTIHPSYVLRVREEADRKRAYLGLVKDLRLCRTALVRRGV